MVETLDAAVGRRGSLRASGRPERVGTFLLTVLAVVPVGLAAWTAYRAPRIHVLLDYWYVLAKVTADDGSLLPGMLFTYHVDQPFVVPSLVFWADAAWLGGANRALTLLTVALLVAMVVMLWAMLPAMLSPVRKAALTAGFAWLVCSSHLAELWLQGTNGISWVPAVACAVLAILFAHRGRAWAAWVVAALGCLCFGAGLPVWFAVALTAWMRRDRTWQVITPLAMGVLAVAAWFVTKPAGPQSLATSAIDPDRRLSVFAATLGGLWSADLPAVAVIAGGATVAALILLAWPGLRRRPAPGPAIAGPAAGWVGLAAYAVMLAGLVALGRTTTVAVAGGNVGLLSRYALAAALATSALLVLATLSRPVLPLRYLVIGVVTVGLVTHSLGGAKQDAARAAYAPLGVAAVALRVGATSTLAGLQIEPSVIPAARALGAYPFTEDFTLGCGGHELGQRLDLGALPVLPAPAAAGASKGVIDTPVLTGDSLLSGWALIDNRPPECVLVVDGAGTIVGGGVTGLSRPDTSQPGWRAVAAPGATDLAVIVVGNGTPYRIMSTSQ